MTPMIDVVFLLLVFFLASTSFQKVEHTLPGAVTTAAASAGNAVAVPPPPERDFDEVIIRIRRQGTPRYQINEVPLDSLAQVDGYLQQLAQLHRQAPVIVDPEEDVPLGDAIQVYDVGRRHGFTVAFATPIELDQQ